MLNERLDELFDRGCRNISSLDEKELRHFDALAHEMLMNMRVQYMRAYDLKHAEEMERMETLCNLWSEREGFVQRWKVNRTPIEQPCREMFERTFGKRAT